MSEFVNTGTIIENVLIFHFGLIDGKMYLLQIENKNKVEYPRFNTDTNSPLSNDTTPEQIMNMINTLNTTGSNLMQFNNALTAQSSNIANTVKTQTPVSTNKYTDFDDNEVYKEIRDVTDFKKKFSKVEVLAYLTGLRKNGKITNANRDIHDKLYNLIQPNLNNQTKFYDLSFTEEDSTTKTGLDLLKILVISNSSKYDELQTKLQNTINKMFNDKTQLIPDEYRNALTQLLYCVKSKKDFNYIVTDSSTLIFTFNSLLENKLEILNNIIKNLKNTHFKRDGDKNWVKENTFRPVYCDYETIFKCEDSSRISRKRMGSLSTPYKDLFGNTVIAFLGKILEDPTKITLNKP